MAAKPQMYVLTGMVKGLRQFVQNWAEGFPPCEETLK
jgi:hypothetical protein